MSDLIKRLRSAVGDGDVIYLANRCTEAADALDALNARIAELIEALRPFAEPHGMGDNYVQFHPRLIATARAALAKQQDQT